tara:strand:+ start:3385 stop:4110 length:726 start_codon:yes stop_codon:yes gene_type:complete
MQIAFISPIDDLGYDYTNYHMALTHLVLKYPDYADHYKKLAENGSFVILDNSLIELGEAASLEKVLEAAAIINPSEIVLTDVYKKGDETVNSVDNDLIVLNRNPEKYKFQLQAVCHGETEEIWKDTWNRLQQYREINTIAIPKVTEHQFGSRTPLVKWAIENNENNKEIHLLGCWSDITEFKDYTMEMKEKIRGVDTSIVYHCAIDNTEKKPDWKIDLEKSYKIDPLIMIKKQQKALSFID